MRRTREDTEISKLRILMASEKEFCNRGFSAANIETIARDAHMSKAAIFWHFENKAGLFRAAIQRAISRVRSIFEEVFLSHTTVPVMERCRDVIKKVRKDQAFEMLLALANADKTGDIPKELLSECNSQISFFLKDTIKYFEDASVNGDLIVEADIASITMTIMLVMSGFSFFTSLKSLIEPIGNRVSEEDVINIVFNGLVSFQKRG
jgi:AcrR family transcriptional regulator